MKNEGEDGGDQVNQVQEMDLLGGMGDASEPNAGVTAGNLLDTGIDLLGGGAASAQPNVSDLLGGPALGSSNANNDLLGGSDANDLLGGGGGANDLLGGPA